MLDLYLIRHAESEKNARPEIIGGRSNDSPLSEKGIMQAHLLGSYLASMVKAFDEVYVSPAVRTIKTAEISLPYLGFPLEKIILKDELLEIDQGDFTGRNRFEVYTPELRHILDESEGNFRPPNGESQRDVEARMVNVLTPLLSQKEDYLRVAVFGHGLAFKCFLRYVLNSAPRMTYKIHLDNASITRLQHDTNGWHVLSVNDAWHLR